MWPRHDQLLAPPSCHSPSLELLTSRYRPPSTPLGPLPSSSLSCCPDRVRRPSCVARRHRIRRLAVFHHLLPPQMLLHVFSTSRTSTTIPSCSNWAHALTVIYRLHLFFRRRRVPSSIMRRNSHLGTYFPATFDLRRLCSPTTSLSGRCLVLALAQLVDVVS